MYLSFRLVCLGKKTFELWYARVHNTGTLESASAEFVVKYVGSAAISPERSQRISKALWGRTTHYKSSEMTGPRNDSPWCATAWFCTLSGPNKY